MSGFCLSGSFTFILFISSLPIKWCVLWTMYLGVFFCFIFCFWCPVSRSDSLYYHYLKLRWTVRLFLRQVLRGGHCTCWITAATCLPTLITCPCHWGPAPTVPDCAGGSRLPRAAPTPTPSGPSTTSWLVDRRSTPAPFSRVLTLTFHSRCKQWSLMWCCLLCAWHWSSAVHVFIPVACESRECFLS